MKADIKRKALRRLSLIRGQLGGVVKMVDDERYCVDIITQSSAIKEALSRVDDLILQNHLETHVVHQMKAGKEKIAVKEILKVYGVKRR